MGRTTKLYHGLLLVLFYAGSAQLLGGATLSFAGDLRTDATFVSCGPGCTLNDGNSDGDFAQYAAVTRAFTVSAPSVVQAISFSYGGGRNGAGATVTEGGFAPYLSLFRADGGFVASTFNGLTCPAGAQINTVSGQCYDVQLLTGQLSPGDYQIAVSAYLNLSLAENLGVGTLGDGFTGLGNLGAGEDLRYAFDVILTAATPVPEPGAAGITVLALSFLVVMHNRRVRNEE